VIVFTNTIQDFALLGKGHCCDGGGGGGGGDWYLSSTYNVQSIVLSSAH
jgi:hypothetical protein